MLRTVSGGGGRAVMCSGSQGITGDRGCDVGWQGNAFMDIQQEGIYCILYDGDVRPYDN